MSVEPLYAGIELQGLAALLTRAIRQPLEEASAVALGPFSIIRYQVVDVEDPRTGQVVDEAKTGHRPNTARLLQHSEIVAASHLPSDGGNERSLVEMRSELRHYWKATADVLI